MKTIYTYLISLFLVSPALAQTAGNWTFNNTLNGTPGSSITVSAMSLGSSIPSQAYNSGTEWYGEGGWPTTSTPDLNAYVQFTLNATAAHYLVLNNIKLVQRRSSTGTPAGSGPLSWSVRSSLDNYATDIYVGTQDHNYATYTVNLPSQFQAIATGVTFRIYGYNVTMSSGGSNRFVFDNISVTGSSVSGVLATQSISLAASQLAAGKIALQYNVTGFDESADLTIQRSVNGSDFTSVYRQTASAATTSYTYEDQAAPAAGTVYYRVAGSNADGSEYISPIVAVRQSAAADTKIRSVFVRGGSVQTILQLESAGAYQLFVWSQDGKALARQTGNGVAGEMTADIQLGSSLPRGVYVLTLVKDGQRMSRQFVL